MNTHEILLLGGNGFLGTGIQRELLKRKLTFKSIDLDDIDLSIDLNVCSLAHVFEHHDNIVLLAAKVGAKLFETDAQHAAECNDKIYSNVMSALTLAAKTFKKKFSFSFYSTSEIYGSLANVDEMLSCDSKCKFDFSNKRHLYAYGKWKAEQQCQCLFDQNVLSSFKIIRPFNVYGFNQKRGVVHDMIKSALSENTIRYAVDTTRTMTDVDFASKQAVDVILSDKNAKINIADEKCSVSMKTLAIAINEILNMNCKLIELPYDKSVQYRHVSKMNNDIESVKSIMSRHVLELANQLKTSYKPV